MCEQEDNGKVVLFFIVTHVCETECEWNLFGGVCD
jgi:hypothetical protein